VIDDKAGSAQTETPARVLQPKGSAKRHTTVRLGVIAAVLAAAMSLAPSAMAAPAPDKDLCKSGGYADHTNPATGARFANQGECVSYVNKGGRLTTLLVDVEPGTSNGDSVSIGITGLPPNNRVGGFINWADEPRMPWRPAGRADADGSRTVLLELSSHACERFPVTFEVYDPATELYVRSDESFTPARCQA
jgi:hypothetical protein